MSLGGPNLADNNYCGHFNLDQTIFLALIGTIRGCSLSIGLQVSHTVTVHPAK